MTSRPLSVGIVVLWLSSMSWLVVAKVLPSLLVGDPPTYASVVDTRAHALDWEILWDDEPVGRATSTMKHRADLTTQISSNVRLENLSMSKMAPAWMHGILGMNGAELRVTFATRSQFNIDPLGQLIDFDTTLSIDQMRDAVSVHGTVQGGRLLVDFRVGESHSSTEAYLPPTGMVSDAFSPQARLPKLRVGQTWTEPVYSPFRPSNSPMEILQVTVERRESLVWRGELHPTLVVVYRSDAGANVSSIERERGRTWVDESGAVLKQEARVLNSRLTFIRITPLGEEATEDDDDVAVLPAPRRRP